MVWPLPNTWAAQSHEERKACPTSAAKHHRDYAMDTLVLCTRLCLGSLPGALYGTLHQHSWRYWRRYLARTLLLASAAASSAWWTALVLLLPADPPVRADRRRVWHRGPNSLHCLPHAFSSLHGLLAHWQCCHLHLGWREDALADDPHDHAIADSCRHWPGTRHCEMHQFGQELVGQAWHCAAYSHSCGGRRTTRTCARSSQQERGHCWYRRNFCRSDGSALIGANHT